jgi:hypothetical protein
MSRSQTRPASVRRRCLARATLHDEESRSFQVLESPHGRRLVHVTMAPPTERPQIAVMLPRQAFIGGMVQVNALVGSARRATSREPVEVLASAKFPLGRPQVPSVFGRVVRHGRDHYPSPQKVRRMSSNDANQRVPMRVRKP